MRWIELLRFKLNKSPDIKNSTIIYAIDKTKNTLFIILC